MHSFPERFAKLFSELRHLTLISILALPFLLAWIMMLVGETKERRKDV